MQHITVKFDREVYISGLHIQFQGGFSCKQIDFTESNPAETGANSCCLSSIYPEDVNNKQVFQLDKELKTTTLRLLMLKPTDFFGRIIVYHLDFIGGAS